MKISLYIFFYGKSIYHFTYPSSMRVLALIFRSLIHFELTLCLWCQEMLQIYSLHVDNQLSKYHLLKILSFSPLNYLGENQLTINIRVYMWILNFISLINTSILVPILHCPDYCSCVSSMELCGLPIFFSILFWLFRVSYISIRILGSAFNFCQRCKLGFWHGLYWICS